VTKFAIVSAEDIIQPSTLVFLAPYNKLFLLNILFPTPTVY